MRLNQPYYIEKRCGTGHIDLNSSWDFFGSDTEFKTPKQIEDCLWNLKTDLPNSVGHSLYNAGVLPEPYFGMNSKLYSNIDEKIWYYRKKFLLNDFNRNDIAFLCFDGVAYYSSVWINGHSLGSHEGMFGGPVCDISRFLKPFAENEIVVEVKACNFGKKEGYYENYYKGKNKEIVPWNIIHDTLTTNGDFVVVGIWNTVRLEILNKYHISRPYIYTKSLCDNRAKLFFEVEISDGTVNELHKYYGREKDNLLEFSNSFASGLTGSVKDDSVDVKIEVFEKENNNLVYSSFDNVKLTDYDNLKCYGNYRELQFFSKEIDIENPKLWYPNGLGEQPLYKVRVSLLHDGEICDEQELNIGIRIIEVNKTHGKKYRSAWGNYGFSVNGKDFFVKGINWTQLDMLYKIDRKEYLWCLKMVQNAGIQMIRVWSGGGMPETDDFYEICDNLGILVWQDHLLANLVNSTAYPLEILEEQEAYNIYRYRNHPSLAVHCGGNEFNPYSDKNAATLLIIRRIIERLDPSRVFYQSSPDGGSAHIYPDIEPAWFNVYYKDIAFVAETGIHSFPCYRSIKKYIATEETSKKLCNFDTPEFVKGFPQLLNHFIEYNPTRIPQMFSRISQINNLDGISLKDICEASQVQSYEFYHLMIQTMRNNYPVTGGILPWVYKRPWLAVGVQILDGDGQACYQYYAICNAYRSIKPCLLQKWTIVAPCETIPLKVSVINQNKENLKDVILELNVYNPDLSVAKAYKKKLDSDECLYEFDDFVLDGKFTDKCFLVSVDCTRNGDILERSVYFYKCTRLFEDSKFLSEYRSKPNGNLTFKNGPWLKQDIKNGIPTKIIAKQLSCAKDGDDYLYSISIKNIGNVIAYPITAEALADNARYFANDNFFMLKPNEEKIINITCDNATEGFRVLAWNSEEVILK